ncbi:MAG: flagellar protein FlaG [Burkholderiaceae bacterium]
MTRQAVRVQAAALAPSNSQASEATKPTKPSAPSPSESGLKVLGEQAGARVVSMQAQQKADQERMMLNHRENRQKLEEAISRLNDQLERKQTNLGFRIDDQTDIVVVSVTNKETGKLIRQIPAEAVVRISQNIESLKGVLFDEAF